MIRQIEPAEFPAATEVIRASFATVAKDFNLTPQNCPAHTSFVTTAERLQTHCDWGWQMYGIYENGLLAGYASVSKDADDICEIHNLAVIPECRHKGYGKRLLDFCKMKAKETGGNKITLGIIEENTLLKNWYIANGFVHTGTRRSEHLPFTVGYMEWEAK